MTMEKVIMRVLPFVIGCALASCTALHDDGPTTATDSRYIARWTVTNTDTGVVLSSGCAEDLWLGRSPSIPSATWEAAHASLMSVSAPAGAHLEESIDLAYVTKTKSAGSTFPNDISYWCNGDDNPQSSEQAFSSYKCVIVADARSACDAERCVRRRRHSTRPPLDRRARRRRPLYVRYEVRSFDRSGDHMERALHRGGHVSDGQHYAARDAPERTAARATRIPRISAAERGGRRAPRTQNGQRVPTRAR
jgi:hypothetical protein